VAAEAFIERGFKHLAFFRFGSSTEWGADGDPLGTALRDAAKSHGATAHIGRLDLDDVPDGHGKNVRKTGELAEWLRDLPKPVAVLAYNFKMGVRITSACEAAGLSVPEEVAIACRGDNAPLHQTAPVPLSGIEINKYEIGRQAVRLMKRLVDGKRPPAKPILVPVKGFVERRSTDIFAISDPLVAKAVRFMWDHLSRPLLVEDVAEEVGVSLNTLKRAFRRTLNRGVGAELRRKRLETCKELLRGGKMTLDQVARAVGFAGPRHLHRAFKDAFGMTPGEYRKSHRIQAAT
jgi:LacI family transcriptional regulator